MGGPVSLAEIAEIGSRTLASAADEIAAVTQLVQRTTGVDITVVSEVTADHLYVFRGLETTASLPIAPGAAIPYAASLCSRIHAGEAPATVPDTRAEPALWQHWLALKEGLGVDWDILAFCTRDVLLPDGTRYGTLCLHHLRERTFSDDEQALLGVLARLLGLELWRERAGRELLDAVGAYEEAERRRVELADELQHELRAPLQVIDGYAEGMLDGVIARDDEHVTLVRREAGRAIQLLADVADLVRLELEARDDEAAAVDAAAVAAEMGARLAPLAEAARIALVVEAVPARVPLSARRLEQLFVNLVRNSIRAVESGGGTRITVFVRAEAGVVEAGVEDDGPGIAAGELPRAFDRFYRGSSGGIGAQGSGLGLTIARRIAAAAGGVIAAEPLEPRGLRVVARLPAAGQAAAGHAEGPLQAP